MEYAIIFSSKTGNTKLLANKIYETLSKDDCRYFGDIKDYKLNIKDIYVGFWTDKGVADETCLEFLKNIKNKNIFLFGTAGFGESEEYFERIISNTLKNIDKSNSIKGSFISQGKMPMTTKERYEKIKKEGNNPNIDRLIDNFDKALSHPDNDDLNNLAKIVKGL